MTKNKKNKTRKKVLYLVIFLSLLSLSTALYVYLIKSRESNTQEQIAPVNTINYSEPTNQDKAESSRNKNEITQNMDKPIDVNQSSDLPISVTITRANRTIIGVYIEKLPEGTCELSITQKGIEKISMRAKVIAQADYSTCEGFSVESSKLDETPFNVNISVISGNRKGSANQEVN